MNYQLLQKDIVVNTDKKWLKRHGYSSKAVRLYGELAKAPQDLSDVNMAEQCKFSVRSVQEGKRELVYSGLLEVHKINSNTIIMVLGDKAIRAYARRIKASEDARVYRKALENMCLEEPAEESLEDDTIAVYTQEDMQSLYDRIQRPKPLDLVEVL